MKAILSGICVVMAMSAAMTAQAATTLTDSIVFSADGAGNNWNGWAWNTQGSPADTRGIWNSYYSTSTDPANPAFIPSANDAGTQIAVALTGGTYDFLIYGESVTTDLDALQHFVLNLYFDGDQSAPKISAVAGPSCATVCAASNANGLDLWGNSGATESGVLSFISGGQRITLTAFDWAISDVDKVWPYWANDIPYDEGSGQVDFVGHIQLQVAAVPLPATLSLLVGAVGALALRRRSRTDLV